MKRHTRSVFCGLILSATAIAQGDGVRESLMVTEWASYSMTIGGTSTAPTKATTIVVDQASWRRVGDSMEISYAYGHSNNAGAAGGSGTYLFPLPSGYSIDSNKVYISTNSDQGALVGVASGYEPSVAGTGYVWPYSTSQLAVVLKQQSGGGTTSITGPVSSTHYPMTSASFSVRFQARVPISGWTRD